MKKNIPLILVFLIITENVFSLDTTSAKLMPLKAGNVWTYHWYFAFGPPTTGNFKNTITGTTTMNGHMYFVVSTTGSTTQITYVRIDSATTNYIQYASTNSCSWLENEIIQDSLCSKLNDSALAQCYPWYKCTDTTNTQIFGQIIPYKSFTWSTFEQGVNRKYARNIGLIYSVRTALNYFYETTLKGCVIDGIVYGDTSITGLQPVSSEVPNKFCLSQNYPNPFNPITKIKFNIPPSSGARGVTRIVVYNVLGREITTLVDEQLKSGTYETEWDGTNYPSGVYFYKLITAGYTETRKMVLVK
jgi:hypothetical protein